MRYLLRDTLLFVLDDHQKFAETWSPRLRPMPKF